MIEKAAIILYESGFNIAFTGAGVSRESGIPTYREKGGLWDRYDPGKYASIQGFMEDPSYYWSFFRDVRYPLIKKAEPNPGHLALADMERMGKLRGLITQNIDGLHSKAGSQNVIELHGNTWRIVCTDDCGREYTADEAFQRLQEEMPPRCDCGEILRPDVVFFGEPVSRAALAYKLAQDCESALCIGSSLNVNPAAFIPRIASENNAKLIIVNRGATMYDDIADVCIYGEAGKVLPEIVKAMDSFR